MFDEATRELLADKFDKANKQFVENQSKIYEKWLSDRAVDASVDFYSSDAGQDVINAMPHINQELAVIAGQLMHEVLTNVIKALDEEGGEFNPFDFS